MNFSNSNLQLYRINTFNKNKIIKYIVSVILLLITVSTFAQQGINYKALIKDGSGNVLASAPVSIQFIIYEGAALTTNVYQESHTVNTDANGIVIVNIGQGTSSDVFANINWGIDQHFLNVQVNTGSGLIDMGTTEFMTVPYAKHAEHATTAANVTGLEKITEGSHTGWRLTGRNSLNYGNIGVDATDLSYSNSTSITNGATGLASTAMGSNTTASGDYSTAMGFGSIASGTYSTAMGGGSTASGAYSTAMGGGSIVSGDYATAMGLGTRATAYASVAMGRYNIGSSLSATTWYATDPLFEIGNGTSSTSSNALTVLKNGTIIAPSVTNALITTAGAKALITKEYADTNLTASGLEKITEGGNIGWRLIGQNLANYGNIGVNATDLSYSGFNQTPPHGATGNSSTAMGSNTTASGDFSISMGNETTALGRNSTAIGYHTNAIGLSSTAMGGTTIASGTVSTAMGLQTKAEAYGSIAAGRFNIGGGSATTWTTTDPLFEIGNGADASNLSNAFTVYKNGNTDVNGILRAQNNVWPTTGSGIEIAYDPIFVAGVYPSFKFGAGYIQSYSRDLSEFRPLFLGATNVLPVNDNSFGLGNATFRWLQVYAVNGTIQTSDRRMKKDINNIKYGLNTLMKLRPVSYKWKKGNQDVNLGLIAQEVQKLIPEVIDIGDDKDKTLGMKYTELIPVLISAIQEQQNIIEQQKTKNQQLRAELSTQNKNIENLVKRMDVLEASNQ
ncbi:MAG: hypothetical protein GXO84_05280 [Chlorobi bacterium]|nr:hypothetical protein [Chlorobiota bacterium]